MKGYDSRTCIYDSDLASENMQLLSCQYETDSEKLNHQLNGRICKIRTADRVNEIKFDDSHLLEV